MRLSDFRVGDLLEITTRAARGTEVRRAQVTCINYNGNGLVTYCGDYSAESKLQTGSGAFNPCGLPRTGFGLVVDVKTVGHKWIGG